MTTLFVSPLPSPFSPPTCSSLRHALPDMLFSTYAQQGGRTRHDWKSQQQQVTAASDSSRRYISRPALSLAFHSLPSTMLLPTCCLRPTLNGEGTPDMARSRVAGNSKRRQQKVRAADGTFLAPPCPLPSTPRTCSCSPQFAPPNISSPTYAQQGEHAGHDGKSRQEATAPGDKFLALPPLSPASLSPPTCSRRSAASSPTSSPRQHFHRRLVSHLSSIHSGFCLDLRLRNTMPVLSTVLPWRMKRSTTAGSDTDPVDYVDFTEGTGGHGEAPPITEDPLIGTPPTAWANFLDPKLRKYPGHESQIR